VSFAITSYSNDGSGNVNLACSGGITGGASNGLHTLMITVAGFSGIDSNGFDTSLMNGTWYCLSSDATDVELEMYAPADITIGGSTSGPTLTVGSQATVEGFFDDGWHPTTEINGGGVGGFFLAGWEQPMFLAVQSPYATFVIAPLYPEEGQIFPTGQVNDADYIVVSVKN
jgi:hypothetical protein